MIGLIMPLPVFTGFDDDGDPIPGGLVHTFASGTTTPEPTYSDADLTVPNANPVLLDAAGRAVVFLVPGVSYTIALHTAADVPVWSQDDILVSADESSVFATAGETLTADSVAYLASGAGGDTAGLWYLADRADAFSSTLPPIGMVATAIGTGETRLIQTSGMVTGLSGLTPGAPYYVGSAGALSATPTGLIRFVGTAISPTTLFLAANPASAATSLPVVQTSTLSGAQNNFVLTDGVQTLFLDPPADIAITGFTARYHGQRLLVLIRQGGFTATFANASGSSAAANRLVNLVSSGLTRIKGAGFVEYVYDTTLSVWWMIRHDQGEDISPTFAAGNFSASGSMTWTLAAGDVPTCSYRLVGRQLFVRMKLLTTTVGGVVSSQLFVSNGAYGGYTSMASVRQGVQVDDNAAGVITACWAEIGAAATFITIGKNAGGNFTLSTNLTSVYLNMVFEVS